MKNIIILVMVLSTVCLGHSSPDFTGDGIVNFDDFSIFSDYWLEYPDVQRFARTATCIVAASDSENKIDADYVCDGTADNVEIQAAIDALPEMGGTVYFLAGNYYIANAILFNGSQRFVGSSMLGTRFYLTADDDMFRFAGGTENTEYYSEWDNLYMYGNKDIRSSGWAINGTRVGSADIVDCRVTRCYIMHFYDGGVRMFNCYGWVISNSAIEHNRGCAVTAVGGSALMMSDTTIAQNTATSETTAVRLASANNLITNCRFEDNGNNGLFLSIADETLISNCTFKGNGADGINGSYPNGNTNGLELSNSDRVVISNCVFNGYNSAEESNTQDYGILIWANCLDTKISNCQFVNNEAEIVEYQYSNKPLLTTYTRQHTERFVDVKQEDVDDLHATEAGSGAFKEVTINITQPDVPRNVTISCTNNATPKGIVVVEGINTFGRKHYESITIVAGGTATGVDAFATITSYTIPAGVSVADTVSLGTGTKLGLSNLFFKDADIFKVNKNGSDMTSYTATSYPADATNTKCTVDVGAIDAGDTDDFTIWYKTEYE